MASRSFGCRATRTRSAAPSTGRPSSRPSPRRQSARRASSPSVAPAVRRRRSHRRCAAAQVRPALPAARAATERSDALPRERRVRLRRPPGLRRHRGAVRVPERHAGAAAPAPWDGVLGYAARGNPAQRRDGPRGARAAPRRLCAGQGVRGRRLCDDRPLRRGGLANPSKDAAHGRRDAARLARRNLPRPTPQRVRHGRGRPAVRFPHVESRTRCESDTSTPSTAARALTQSSSHQAILCRMIE
mmetsp:Transcript_17942/g.56609  ORF Transcript_17942/g.56609 Transcript_17942/m.56609 type:complete len:244 (+) Transcript_17942:189-920(+)